ncbi:hypothetical protein O181_131931 [Austropuccinia psidii MF-1]|uniref:Uncharacterized protein n=1 Tax=Austropuccinia psidii MF-1 TaxID=1389203 RepID=A0A9Q3L522_9BASI|nr:hypothetical protein [Austropuccinia psidii MF-1]
MESSMNVFSLHIDQAVPMPPPPFINAPGISVSSIANPTGSQCGNEYPPYPRDYLLNPSSTRSENQASISHSVRERQPMLKIPPINGKRGMDKFQKISGWLNHRGHQSQGEVSGVLTCRLFFLGQGRLIKLFSSNFFRCSTSKEKYENKGNCF